MTVKPLISLLDGDDGSIAIALTERDGSHGCVGPTLYVSSFGDSVRAYARGIFAERAGSPDGANVQRDSITSALSRVEQLALDKMYAGRGSVREAAHVRVVVLWAAMTIQVLIEQRAPRADQVGSIERRLDRLISLVGSDGIDPLIVDTAPFTAREQPARSSREQRMVTQVFAHIRGHRRQRVQSAPAAA